MNYSRIYLLVILTTWSWSVYSQSITYVANVGVLIENSGSKVLVDALFAQENPKFDAPSSDKIDDMVKGVAPFQGINMVLFTHAHNDHFDPLITLDYMKTNLKAKMIAPSQALDSIKTFSDIPDQVVKRMITYPWKKGWRFTSEGPISIKSAYTIHGGKVNYKVQNLIHLIQLGNKKILHLGDTQMDLSNFQNMRLTYEDIDVAIVPFWYLSSHYGLELLKDYVDADKYIGVHYPIGGKSEFMKKIQELSPEATVFRSSGQKVNF